MPKPKPAPLQLLRPLQPPRKAQPVPEAFEQPAPSAPRPRRPGAAPPEPSEPPASHEPPLSSRQRATKTAAPKAERATEHGSAAEGAYRRDAAGKVARYQPPRAEAPAAAPTPPKPPPPPHQQQQGKLKSAVLDRDPPTPPPLASSSWCVRLGAARRTREACLRYREEHCTGTPPAPSSPTLWRLAPRPLPAQLPPSEAHAQHQYWEAQQLASYKQWHGMWNAPSWWWPRLATRAS